MDEKRNFCRSCYCVDMYVKVRVKAGAKKEIFAALRNDRFEISVKEPASENRANMRVIELIAKYFKVPMRAVRIKSGHHSASKILSIL